MNNFESKQFGDVPLEAYFMTRDEKGLLQSFQKKDSQTAKNLLTKQLVTFNLLIVTIQSLLTKVSVFMNWVSRVVAIPAGCKPAASG